MLAPDFALSTQALLKQHGPLKTGSPDCVHVCTSALHNDLCETHFSVFTMSVTVTLCQLRLMVTFTGLFHHKHTHTAVDQREGLSTPSRNCKAKREVANLTPLCLSISRAVSSVFFKLLCLLASPFTHLFIHALTLLSLSLTFSKTFSLSGSLLSHSAPCHSPLPYLFFPSSGDGD